MYTSGQRSGGCATTSMYLGVRSEEWCAALVMRVVLRIRGSQVGVGTRGAAKWQTEALGLRRARLAPAEKVNDLKSTAELVPPAGGWGLSLSTERLHQLHSVDSSLLVKMRYCQLGRPKGGGRKDSPAAVGATNSWWVKQIVGAPATTAVTTVTVPS